VTTIMPPALILAAGLGTRLRPLTFCRAKPAVPVAGVPLIVRHLKGLADQDVSDVVVNLHHRPETIAAVVGDGAASGCRVRYSWEPVLLGSAGGPRHALSLLGDRFFLLNGDTLCDVNLGQLLDTHLSSGALVTLAVTPNLATKRYGGVLVDPDGWVTRFVPSSDNQRGLHFVGVQLVEASVFKPLTDGTPTASVGGIYDKLLTRPGQVAVHRVDKRFLDIGTPADYLATHRSISAAPTSKEFSSGHRCLVHPSARLDGSVLWNDVTVGAHCRVTNCVLADGVRLPDGTNLDRHTVVQMPAEAQAETTMFGVRQLGDLLIAQI